MPSWFEETNLVEDQQVKVLFIPFQNPNVACIQVSDLGAPVLVLKWQIGEILMVQLLHRCTKLQFQWRSTLQLNIGILKLVFLVLAETARRLFILPAYN